MHIAFAFLENPVLRVIRHVVTAADAVIDVFAKLGGVWVGRITNFDTELTVAHEVVPFDDLLIRIVVTAVAWEAV